ncbi:methyltransferase domain-containing protein [Candidatus Pelagibacter ubique]|nr:methyltransferase domain-containing protein [Candidatus Pelagibacter ubique]
MSLKNFLKNNLPDFYFIFLYKIILCIRVLFWRVQIIYCPICVKSKKTFYTGLFPWINLVCSGCLSLSRQRLIVNYLKKNDNLNKKKIIHFAPEQSLTKFINENYKIKKYDKVDLIPNKQIIHIDIENINKNYYHNYDLVICNHVLEHVHFIKAISNLKKLVKKNGKIFLTFPIIDSWEKNYINNKIKKDYDRLLHFQQFDHLLLFGREIDNYLADKNFSCTKYIATGKESVKFGLIQGETLFILKRIK